MIGFGIGKGSTAAQAEAKFKDLTPGNDGHGWCFAAAEGNQGGRFCVQHR